MDRLLRYRSDVSIALEELQRNKNQIEVCAQVTANSELLPSMFSKKQMMAIILWCHLQQVVLGDSPAKILQ